MSYSSHEAERLIETLYDQHAKALIKQGWHYIGCQQYLLPIVEDCLQEVFLSAHTNREKLLHHPNPEGWLRKAMDIRLKKHIPAERKIGKNSLVLDEDVAAHADAAAGDALEDFLTREENGALARNVLAALKERDRQLLTARYIDNKPLAQIAKERNTSVNTIQVQLDRAKKQAKKICPSLVNLLILMVFFAYR